MKKYNLKLSALVLLAAMAISSCSVHNREYNRRPPRHDRHDHDDRHRDHGDDHYNRSF